MSVDEFVMDLNEINHWEIDAGSSDGWKMEKGRYVCLVPKCQQRDLSFGQKFAFLRHWDEIHTRDLTLYVCNLAPHCRQYRRSYDLLRHFIKAHNLSPEMAKVQAKPGTARTKSVSNYNFVDPGSLRVFPKRPNTVLGAVKLASVAPGVTGMGQNDVPPEKVKVNFCPNEIDEEVTITLGSPAKIPGKENNEATIQLEVKGPVLLVPKPECRLVPNSLLSKQDMQRLEQLEEEEVLCRQKIQEWRDREERVRSELTELRNKR